MYFSNVSLPLCRILSAGLLLPIACLYSLFFPLESALAGEEETKLLHLFAEKKKKEAIERIDVEVKGVTGELRNNVYNHLTIYRLRSSPRLQQISVNQLFRQAETDIANALAPYGYYNPKIQSTLKEKNRKKGQPSRWLASFTIDPGKPVLVAALTIHIVGKGQHNKKLVQYVNDFALKKGVQLNQKIYEEEKKKLIQAALEEGYLNAAFIRSEVRIDPEENRGWIWLNFDTGKRFRFGDTTVVAQSPGSLDSELLQGYLPWNKGEPYDLAKLFELQAILYSTDFFSTVDIRGKTQKADNDYIPIEAVVHFSQKTNKYTVGFGYATDVGVRAKLKWKNKMLSPSGDKVGVALEVAEYEKNIFLSYERPKKENPRYDHYFLSSSYQEKSWDDTYTRPFILTAGREYTSPTFNFGGSLEYHNESYNIGGRTNTSNLIIPSASIGFVLADDITDIKNGLRLDTGIKGATKDLFSDTNFFQWTVSGKVVLSPFSRWVLSDRAAWGITLGDKIATIPPSLRFYAGGDNSIRGYAYKSIGPEDSEGKVIGGKYLLVQSVEVERLIGEYFGLAAFWDIGTATNDLSLNFDQGVGIGLRVHMPFGEIKLDCASAISEPGNPLRIHFSVGGTL